MAVAVADAVASVYLAEARSGASLTIEACLLLSASLLLKAGHLNLGVHNRDKGSTVSAPAN